MASTEHNIEWFISENEISDTVREWYSVCYSKDKFVAIAHDSNIFAYSTDGINWTEGTISDTSRNWCFIYYYNAKFIAITEDSDVFAYSTDGITWTEDIINNVYTKKDPNSTMFSELKQNPLMEPITKESVCYGNGKHVSIDFGNKFAYSVEDDNWSEVTIGDTIRNWISICYGNGKYVAVAHASNISLSIEDLPTS